MGTCMSLHKVGVLYTLKISTEDFNKMRTYVPDYTDEEIIEVISKYETRGEIRISSDSSYYYMAIRRGLTEYLPALKIIGQVN